VPLRAQPRLVFNGLRLYYKKVKIMKRVLVVNVNWVGDVVFSTPIFKAIKSYWPDAFIACLAVPRVQEVLESCPYLDEIIVYDERGSHRGLWGKFKLILNLRQHHFDIAFLLHRSWTRAFLVYCAAIKERVGYDTKNRGKLLTHKVPLPEVLLHRSDIYLNVIEHFGFTVKDRTCELKVDLKAQEQIQELLSKHNISQNDVIIIVNVGGNWDLKKWPLEYFTEFLSRLTHECSVKVIIPGALKDVKVAQEVSRKSGIQPVILAGQTNLKQLIALMKRASLVISADSGPMHIASSVGTGGIALFGPTRPELTGPRGPGQFRILQKDVGCNRKACYFLECPDNKCMQAITVDDVLKEVRLLLSMNK